MHGKGIPERCPDSPGKQPHPEPPSVPCRPAHHPSQPEAGLAGRAHGDAPGGDVGGSLQRLDDPGGLAEGAGAHHVHLPHPEPGGEERCSVSYNKLREWYLSFQNGEKDGKIQIRSF